MLDVASIIKARSSSVGVSEVATPFVVEEDALVAISR